MSTTALDIITNALTEIGAIAQGESAPAGDAIFCLSKLNRLLDNWNTESLFVYGTQFADFVLTPGKNPHTIGASGADFLVATNRPPKIEAADLVLTDVTPNIYRPLAIVDDAWWMSNPAPTISTQIPYYLYPNYGWPLGQLYLWPVPSTAYTIRLLLWSLLGPLALADTFTLPPGYEDAVTLTLAEALAAPFGMPLNAALVQQAAMARGRIKSLNSEAPTMACDHGVQSVGGPQARSSMANFLSGFFN